MTITKKEAIKNIYGVPEINGIFIKHIENLFFEQIKEVTCAKRK